MKLKEFYDFVIQAGIESDPRGRDGVVKELGLRKTDYEKLPQGDKDDYDTERLKNPYADTRILCGTGEEEVKSVLVGIDIDTAEILLADKLSETYRREKGKKIDLLLSHHPSGRAYATFYDVMHMQAEILERFGVPINIGEGILEPRIKEVSRKILPLNHLRAVDAAKLLGIIFMSVHTPADNHVTSFLQNLFEEKKPYVLSDVIDILRAIPEYKQAQKETIGPNLFIGSKERKVGRIFVDMTGGTEGSVEVFEKLSNSGVGTVVGMHMSEEHRKNAEKYHINVVIAGHISSDTLGLNLLLDNVEKKFGKLDIIECSGFRRVKRMRG